MNPFVDMAALALSLPQVFKGLLALALIVAVYRVFFRSSGSRPKQSPAAKSGGVDGLLHEQVAMDFGGAPSPRLEGVMTPPMGMVYSNLSDAVPFENEFAKGCFLSLHRATHDKELDAAGYCGDDHGNYFAGKKRIWEARFQMKFKVFPASTDLRFGIELEEYVPLSKSEKASMKVVVKMLKKIVSSCHHSPGDDPKTTREPLERPLFVMPLWAFDQIIVTPPGEDPPPLTDHATIEQAGSKRSGRVNAFRQEVDGLDFVKDATYTFCFWGISRYLDKFAWQVRGIPVITPMDFNKFCGRPPVHVVVFTMNDSDDPEDERFLQSRKNYYFDLAFWSSERRPESRHLKPLLKGMHTEAEKTEVKKRRGCIPRVACCTER